MRAVQAIALRGTPLRSKRNRSHPREHYVQVLRDGMEGPEMGTNAVNSRKDTSVAARCFYVRGSTQRGGERARECTLQGAPRGDGCVNLERTP